MTLDQWLAAYSQAWQNKDDTALANLFTDDGLYRSSPTQPPHQGREAIAAYWRRATASQTDLALRFGTPVIAGDRVAVEWWATMRDADWHEGDAPTDAVTLPGALILRFAADGRCAELREYYNVLLGSTVPAPSGWGQ
jgi:uncharacterized protein (TIGR02246 family)